MKLSNKEWIGVAVALIVVLIFFFPFFGNIFFSDSSADQYDNLDFPIDTQMSKTNNTQTRDLVLGTGVDASAGKIVTVHYVGRLADGTVFDSSVSRGVPFRFVLGVGQVIPGWDHGFNGMKVGGQRELIIPASEAYGPAGITNPQTGEYVIPPNATLIFEVQLLGVQDLQQS